MPCRSAREKCPPARSRTAPQAACEATNRPGPNLRLAGVLPNEPRLAGSILLNRCAARMLVRRLHLRVRWPLRTSRFGRESLRSIGCSALRTPPPAPLLGATERAGRADRRQSSGRAPVPEDGPQTAGSRSPGAQSLPVVSPRNQQRPATEAVLLTPRGVRRE